jgi:hypothetical protein
MMVFSQLWILLVDAASQFVEGRWGTQQPSSNHATEGLSKSF